MYRSQFPIGSTLVIVVFIIIFVLSAVLMSNPYTPPGHEGYVYEKPRFMGQGGFRGINSGPANYGLSLNRNQVVNIDMRPNTYTESFKILAKDDLNIRFNSHVILALKAGTVQQVVEQYGGEDWYTRFMREPFRTYVRQSVQTYTSVELKAKRDEMAESVRRHVSAYLEKTPFVLVNLVIGDIEYPAIVAQAVEKKLAAQQLLAEKVTQKEIAQKDAEIRIEEAKGIAEAQKIINETLTTNYLQHEAINAQIKMADSPNHTTVYIPVGTNGLPLVLSPK